MMQAKQLKGAYDVSFQSKVETSRAGEDLYPKPECATGRLCRGRERRSPEHMEGWGTGPQPPGIPPCTEGLPYDLAHAGPHVRMFCFLSVLLLCFILSSCIPDLEPVDPDRTFSSAEELVLSIGPRPHDSQGNLSARNYILDTFTALGLQDPHFHTFSDWGVTNGANVVATAPGMTYPEYIFLLGAHYDSIPEGVGAIDNATGVATLMEIARHFSENPPAYTIRFVAFDAEEDGLVGSYYYYNDTQGELPNTLLMLCLDMTQTNETSALSPLVAFVLSPHQALAQTFQQVRTAMGMSGSLFVPIPVDLAEEVSGGALRSDIHHWRDDPLLLAWPWAVSFEYHTIPGWIGQIDKTGLAISTKFILEVVRGLQAYSPGDLQNTATGTLSVDEGVVRMLQEKGGIKPVY